MWQTIRKSSKKYPLILASILALALLVGRIVYLSYVHGSLRLNFLFLAWNLFLAWVPLLISNWLRKDQRAVGLVGLSLVAWLLFFPNAPYLLTDFVHLRPRTSIALWYDTLLLSTYSLLGICLAMRSLEQVRLYIRDCWSIGAARCVVAVTLGLSGLGIYLGRVLRWNSWDAFLNPLGPIQDTFLLFRYPRGHVQAWTLILAFSLGLSICYAVVIRLREKELEADHVP